MSNPVVIWLANLTGLDPVFAVTIVTVLAIILYAAVYALLVRIHVTACEEWRDNPLWLIVFLVVTPVVFILAIIHALITFGGAVYSFNYLLRRQR